MSSQAPRSPGGIRAYDDAEVDGDGRLVVRCEDVPEEAADLTKPDCLRAVLRHLREGAHAKEVVLLNDREIAYGQRAMGILRGLLSAARLLDEFARRAPLPDFADFAARETSSICADCAFRPEAMFAPLQERLLGDPEGFFASLKELIAALEAYEEEGCHACVTATIQDVRVLMNEVGTTRG